MGGGTDAHPRVQTLGHEAVEPIRRRGSLGRRHVEAEQLVEHHRLDGTRVQRRHRGQGIRDVADQRGPRPAEFGDRRNDRLRLRPGGRILQVPHQRRRPGGHRARRRDGAPVSGQLQVGVGVDEAGQHADASEVDLPARGVAAGGRHGTDGTNDAAADVHPAVLYRRRRNGRHPAGAVAGPGHRPAPRRALPSGRLGALGATRNHTADCWRRLPARLRAG